MNMALISKIVLGDKLGIKRWCSVFRVSGMPSERQASGETLEFPWKND
jgi:hypothetical protein